MPINHTSLPQAAPHDSKHSETQRSRRAQPRVPVNLAVVVLLGERELEAIAVNLGLGGVFVEGPQSLDYGTRVELLIALPSLNEPSRLPGVVRWQRAGEHQNKYGFGIQFLELGARETHAIGTLVRDASR
jgi:uncharacterized protein (TIGR02266 family)